MTPVAATVATDTSAGSAGSIRLLDDNWTTFQRLVARARRELDRGQLERAAIAARVAATFAWFNHPGVFASRDLEAVIAQVGRRLAHQPLARLAHGRVLHVATELYDTGGHTQMLASWIASDGAHGHLVCLTGQRGRPVPDKLRRALGHDEARGSVVELDALADTLLGRAARLRSLAATAEVVVLHVHPDDVVPGLAFAPGHRPTAPVCLVNHADHVFWVGTATADVVLNMRHSGAELTTERRGVPTERQDTLTRPLRLSPRRQRRAEARIALDVPGDRLVVATAAAASKYQAVNGTGFLDVVRPLLEKRGDTYLLAAGPMPKGEWAELEEHGLGRALGVLPDIAPVLEAADVYLDSYPFSSLTSMLEAAALGVPVVTLRTPSDEPAVLGADTPELDATLVVAESPRDHRHRVSALLDDELARAGLGRATRIGVEAAHAAGAWVAQVHRVLGTAVAIGGDGPSPAALDVRRTGELDRRVVQLQAQTGWGACELGALRLNAAALPLGRRLGLLVREAAAGHRPSPRLLLSARTARRLRSLRR